MRLSEMIEKLQKIMTDYGDMHVEGIYNGHICNDIEIYCDPNEPIISIEIYGEEELKWLYLN